MNPGRSIFLSLYSLLVYIFSTLAVYILLKQHDWSVFSFIRPSVSQEPAAHAGSPGWLWRRGFVHGPRRTQRTAAVLHGAGLGAGPQDAAPAPVSFSNHLNPLLLWVHWVSVIAGWKTQDEMQKYNFTKYTFRLMKAHTRWNALNSLFPCILM